MRLGVFGGTFNPAHLGHLILAHEALYQLRLDRVLWVLTPGPPHKPDPVIEYWEIRLRMLEIALGDNPGFEISRVDIDRQPPHYAVDTMKLLRFQYPGNQLFYIMGADSLRDLHKWHKPEKMVEMCDGLGFMHRPGVNLNLQSLERKISGIRDKIISIEAPMVDISSSDIRQRISTGKPYRYYLPLAEYEYILQNHLYQA